MTTIYEWGCTADQTFLKKLIVIGTRTCLASKSLDVFCHFHRVREVLLVPNEVFVVFRVFDIQPEDINGHIFLIEPLLNASDIVRADIVPPALMVSKRPMCRERRCPRESRVLSKYIFWGGTR
jgi:hypothetical protein